MIKITIEDQATPMLKNLMKEFPAGVVQGVNDLANNARDEFLWDLPNRMTLRTPWFKPGSMFGFNVKKATISNPAAEIYTRAPWMQLQESGGTKNPRGRHIAIPTTTVRRTKRDLIPKAQRPMGLGSKAFHLKTKSGNEFLAMRVGRGKRSNLKIMYLLSQRAQIRPQLHFVDSIKGYVAMNAERILTRAIERAFRK